MANGNVGIVGGGPVGLVALYECKKRRIKATLYEKRSHIGGVWNMCNSWGHKSTIFNTSSYVTTYNLDFPLFQFLERKYSKDYVDFATGEDFNEYLKEFVEHYDLASMILLNTEIVDIIPGEPGQHFTLKAINVQNKIEKLYNHDYIIIATGRQGNVITPEDSFLSRELKMNSDKIWHTGHWDPLNDTNAASKIMEKTPLKILVVGSGNSAPDAIRDTIMQSQKMGTYENLQILWAPTRDPKSHSVWLTSRYPYEGKKSRLPLDEITSRLSALAPRWIRNIKIKEVSEAIILHNKNESLNFDRDRYCIYDKELIKKALQDRTLHILEDPITRIYQSELLQVAFETTISNKTIVDAVIIGSGYTHNEPKINGKYILKDSFLYRHIMPIEKSYHGRLGFICITSVLGSTMPLAQLEIKWLLYQWFDNEKNLSMNLEIMRTNPNNENIDFSKKRWPGPSMDILAKDMHVHPRIWRNLLSLRCRRRHVALACIFGPWSIYQYATVDETDSERQKRENLILTSTENAYKKCGQSFTFVCVVSDMAYYMSLAAILAVSYMNCDFISSKILNIFKYF